MNIDYELIDKKINYFAMDIISDIISSFAGQLRKEDEANLWILLNEKRIVIVDKPSIEDDLFFDNNIPSAHGPRTKGDGYIHIYPYTYPHLSTEEIIQRYIDHIITHEIFHYIIKLDIKGNYSNPEIDFGHYITEGMVQLMTERLQNYKDRTSNYRKNVDAASIILDKLIDNDDLPLIFQKNYKDIFEKYLELYHIYENYLKEKEFEEKIKPILTDIALKTNWEPKRLISKIKMRSSSELISQLTNFIKERLPSEVDNYSKQLNDLYETIFTENKKSL